MNRAFERGFGLGAAQGPHSPRSYAASPGSRIEPEPAFDDPNSRLLKFSTNLPELSIIRVRSFDVATFVAFGAAHFGVAGNDVLMEFDYPEIYAPVDLGIGRCRLSVAAPKAMVVGDDPSRWSHIRIATKYPGITKRHFAESRRAGGNDKAERCDGAGAELGTVSADR